MDFRPVSVLRGLIAGLVVAAVLMVPVRPALLWAVPWELPLVLALALLPVLRLPLLLLLLASLLLKAGEAGMLAAFNRPFDLLTDWPLLNSALELAVESVGQWTVAAGLAVALAVLLMTARALGWALRQPVALPAALALVLCAVLPAQTTTADLLAGKLVQVRATLADLRTFRAAAEVDRYDGRAGLLSALGDRNAAIVFVESYGRTSFDNPRYARHIDTLHNAEPAIRAAGLEMRSGWLTSPVQGGQSWLAHGTLLSGLRIADQGRYGAMLQSPRRTLVHLAAQAGRHTLAVMPAITLAWPEGPMLGHQEILDAEAMGYRGKRLDWVTMPDQFTLSVLERRMADERGLFATVALISSHAPWVPVIGMRDWDTIGDGAGFAGGWDTRTPEEIWRDPETIRTQYAASADYALRAVTEFAARQGGDPPLLVVLGDHQPAGFVAEGDSRDVPVHLIGPPDLIARFAGWGWSDGLVPAADLSPWPMETFRDRYLDALSDGPSIGG